jgi:hypothetical protein
MHKSIMCMTFMPKVDVLLTQKHLVNTFIWHLLDHGDASTIVCQTSCARPSSLPLRRMSMVWAK